MEILKIVYILMAGYVLGMTNEPMHQLCTQYGHIWWATPLFLGLTCMAALLWPVTLCAVLIYKIYSAATKED